MRKKIDNQDIHKFTIKPKDPFNFELSMEVFRQFKKEIVDLFDGINYRRALLIDNTPILLNLKSIGTINNPKIEVTMLGDCTTNVNKIINITERILNSDLDLNDFYKYFKNDDEILKLCNKFWGLKPPRTPTIFEAIIIAILEQQVMLSFAIKLKSALAFKYGPPMKVHNKNYFTFPTPYALSQSSIDDLHKLQISRRKSEYITDISRLITNNKIDLDEFENLSNSEIIEILTSIRGIGLWTAEYVLVRGLGRLDALPADDVALRNSISAFFRDTKKEISSDDVRKMSENWGKYSGYVGYYLLTEQRFRRIKIVKEAIK